MKYMNKKLFTIENILELLFLGKMKVKSKKGPVNMNLFTGKLTRHKQ